MKLYLPIFAAILLAQGCASYKSIDQATKDQSALDDRIDITSNETDGNDEGFGAFPHLATLGAPPKRVAFVSYFVYSPVAEGDYQSQVLTAAGTRKIANNLRKKGIGPIKQAFKENGMTLLEPAEFLTDGHKKRVFNNFKMKIEGGASLMKGATDWMEDTQSGRTGLAKGAASAEGYRLLLGINSLWPFASVTDSIGYDLTKGLGVDAVLVAVTRVVYDGSHTNLEKADMYLFGPNPIKLAEDDLGGFKDGRKGHLYASVGVPKGFKKVTILPPDSDDEDLKGLDDAKNYVGYDRIARVEAQKIAAYVKKMTTAK